MEATDVRGIYTPSQAFLYKPHRMLLRKMEVRVSKQRKSPMGVQISERGTKPY